MVLGKNHDFLSIFGQKIPWSLYELLMPWRMYSMFCVMSMLMPIANSLIHAINHHKCSAPLQNDLLGTLWSCDYLMKHSASFPVAVAHQHIQHTSADKVSPFQIRETTRKMMKSFSKSGGGSRRSSNWQGCTRSRSSSPRGSICEDALLKGP